VAATKSPEKADAKKDSAASASKDSASTSSSRESTSTSSAAVSKSIPNNGNAAKPIPAAPPRDPARESALSRAVQQIEKQFGKGAVMKLDGEARGAIDGIPTGSLSLDIALGGFGIPRGRVVEIFGPESSGKTTLTLHVIASVQKLGGVAAFIDAEHALDPSWAKRLGVKLDDLLVSQPDTGEQALEICELLVRSNAVDVIVIDSVAALIPRAEIEGEMGDSHMGLQARLMSQALRKLTGAISKSKCTVIFINQIREKIGVMFGNPETTPGGRALKFYASVRIDVRRTQTIKEAEVSVGARTRARVVKNKIAPPFRDAEFDIMFDRGISYEGDLLDLAVLGNIVEKSGAWFNYKTTRLGQGRENAKQFLFDNKDLGEEIRQAVLSSKGLLDAKKALDAAPATDE
jgi:recombination protein RecA